MSDNPGGGLRVLRDQDARARVGARLATRRALNRLAGQLGGRCAHAEIVEQTKPVPLNDVVFKRFVYRRGDTYWRGQLELLKDRLYTIIVKAPNADDAPYLRLVKTFQILGPR